MKTMAITFLVLSIFVSIVGGICYMKTRHTRLYGLSGAWSSFALAAGVGFFMTAGPAWLMEVLRS